MAGTKNPAHGRVFSLPGSGGQEWPYPLCGSVNFGPTRIATRRFACARGYIENIVTSSPQNEPYSEPHMPKYVLTDDSRAA
jgi:hypothetical protein